MQELKFQRAKISDKVQKVLNRRKQTSVTSTSTDALPEESGSFMQPSWSVGLAVDHEYLPVAEQVTDRQVVTSTSLGGPDLRVASRELANAPKCESLGPAVAGGQVNGLVDLASI